MFRHGHEDTGILKNHDMAKTNKQTKNNKFLTMDSEVMTDKEFTRELPENMDRKLNKI
jgi:hypothetical protein